MGNEDSVAVLTLMADSIEVLCCCGSSSCCCSFFMFLTVHILRPVANVELRVEEEPRGAGHQDRSQSHTLVVEIAVVWMGNKDRIAVLALMADNIKP